MRSWRDCGRCYNILRYLIELFELRIATNVHSALQKLFSRLAKDTRVWEGEGKSLEAEAESYRGRKGQVQKETLYSGSSAPESGRSVAFLPCA
jgi:hypothetical protein